MKSFIICLCLIFVQLALSQYTIVDMLEDGQTKSDIIPVGSPIYSQEPILFSFWVPENAEEVLLTLTNTDSDNCDYLDFYLNSDVLPCSTTVLSSSSSFCANAYLIDEVDDVGSQYYIDGNTGNYFTWEVGTYWYLGVARDSMSYASQICSFTIQAAINSSCPNNTVGQQYQNDDDETPQCSPEYSIATNLTTKNGYSYDIPNATEGYNHVWKVDIPAFTGNLMVSVISSTSNLEIYGRSKAAPSADTNDCDGNYQSEDGLYYYTMNCFNPTTGDFYVGIWDYDSTEVQFNASLKMSLQTCGNGTGGYNCSFMTTQTMGNGSVQFDVSDENGWLGYYWKYMYFVIPENYTAEALEINIYTPQDGYFAIRRDAYPEDNYQRISEQTVDVNNETVDWILDYHDWYVPGIIYFGFACFDGDNGTCHFTVTFNTTVTPSYTTGMVNPVTTQALTTQPLTTGAITTGMNTTLTTAPLTTSMNTTLTTAALTTQSMNTTLTTAALTTQSMNTTLTTAAMTTSMNTTLTTQAITTQSLTTQPVTTISTLTTMMMTTGDATTALPAFFLAIASIIVALL